MAQLQSACEDLIQISRRTMTCRSRWPEMGTCHARSYLRSFRRVDIVTLSKRFISVSSRRYVPNRVGNEKTTDASRYFTFSMT